MAVQLPDGSLVHFNSEQCRLLRIVTKFPQDYCSWRALVYSVADGVTDTKANASKGWDRQQMFLKLHVVFTLFLGEFPANYKDVYEHIMLSKPFVTTADIANMFYVDARITSFSLDRWEKLCMILVETNHESASRIFKEATDNVGSYYQSDSLWSLYIEHETTIRSWTTVSDIYRSVLSSPVRGIDGFFSRFMKFANERELEEILSSDESRKFNDKSSYIASREELFQKSKQYLLEVQKFEELIVPDSEIDALDEQIISNWFSYISFLGTKDDIMKVIALYNRASCQLHSYPEFWISFVEYLLSVEKNELAEQQLVFATTNVLKRNVQLLLYSAKFWISNNNLDRARSTYVLIHSILCPNHPEAIEGHAFIELRKHADGNSIFKNAINYEKKKGSSELLPHLVIKYGHFALSAEIPVSFDDIIGELFGQAELSLEILESAISLSSYHGFTSPEHVLKLDEMVQSFISNGSLTNQAEKDTLSSCYSEFLHRYGNSLSLEKAASRHKRLHHGGSPEVSCTKKKRTSHNDIGLFDDDLVVMDLVQFLKKVVLVKDPVSQSGPSKGSKRPKVLPIGTRLLIAIVKSKFKRHRGLRCWGGQLQPKDIFIIYDGTESSSILCSIRKEALFELSEQNFALDWIKMKQHLAPAFTSQQTREPPVYFEDFFHKLIERVPANFLSHVESREMYFFQISCTMFLSTGNARLKLACDLYKSFRDAFSRSEVRFDSLFDSSGLSSELPDDCSNPVLLTVLNHGKEKGVGQLKLEFTPSKLVEANRHLDAHGTEAAKAIGQPVRCQDEVVDIFDHTSGNAFCDIVWDLCRNIHHDELLEDACVAFSSNVVEPPRLNPFLSCLGPRLSPGIAENNCLMAAEPCHLRTELTKNMLSCVLWFGNVQFSVDEVRVFHEFSRFGKVKSLKLRRNILTGLPEGDGLVEFESHKEAQHVMDVMKRELMFGEGSKWDLRFSTFCCSSVCFHSQQGKSILVKDLSLEVTDYVLQEKFLKYPSFAGAIVARDVYTGLSYGFGFVKFADDLDRITALGAEHNKTCLGKPMSLVDQEPRVPDQKNNERPDLNQWVGSYRYAQVQSSGGSCLKVDAVANHVPAMDEHATAYEQTSVEKMNESYATGPGKAVQGCGMKL